MGKVWISDKKVFEIQTSVFGFQTLFYLHTSDNLLPFTYSVRLNVGVSKRNQKKPIASHLKPMVQVQTFGFQTLSEIRTC